MVWKKDFSSLAFLSPGIYVEKLAFTRNREEMLKK